MVLRESHSKKRIQREKATLNAMFLIYCKKLRHNDEPPCEDCMELREYALKQLEKCPFQNLKPTCRNCTIHCYHPDMRETIKKVMRFAGPRMLLKHPILAIQHLFDGLSNKNMTNESLN